MAYRRGFKTEANAIAAEVRSELALSALAPLDPHELAAYLDMPVLPLSSFAHDAELAAAVFSGAERGAFSAVTVFRGRRRTIVHNDSHSAGRQHSNIAHELAHGLLLHEPTPALDEHGCRFWDDDLEDEANFLGAALLVTEDAALSIVRRKVPINVAAAHYQVSEQMMQWRINVTGARKRVERTQRRQKTR